jgi:hypothetical protein
MNKKRKLTENDNQNLIDDNTSNDGTNAADAVTLQDENHEDTYHDNDDHGVPSAQRDNYDNDVELAYINRKRTNYSIKRVSKWTPEMVSIRCFAFHSI